MSKKDGEKNVFEKMLSKVTEPLWNQKPLTPEEALELQKYAQNPQAYVELARNGIQNNNIANVIQRQNELRADRDQRERDQETP